MLTSYHFAAHIAGQIGNEVIELAPFEVCKGTAHFESLFQTILDEGGEGVILRDPSSPNCSGRSPGFLKHKVVMPCTLRSLFVVLTIH